MTPNCKYNLTNANYRKVIQEVKQSLGSDYNYDIFRSVADTFEGDINSLTSEYVLQRYPRKNAPQEKISQESPQSAPSLELPLTEDQAEEERIKAAKDEAKKHEIIAARWARSADGMESFEVSSAGDEFGKKFSALNAVLAEGTVFKMKIKKGRKTIEQTFDVGGYSVEAAYQMVKGYDRNPKGSLINKDGKPMKIALPGDINLLGMLKATPNFCRPFIPAEIDSVLPDSPAQKAGIRRGDKILAINGTAVDSWNEFTQQTGRLADQMTEAKTSADSLRLRTATVVFAHKEALPAGNDSVAAPIAADTATVVLTPELQLGVGMTSILSYYEPTKIKYGFFESFPAGITYGWNVLGGYVGDLKYLFSADGAKSLGGFGAIGSLFPPVWDWHMFWLMTAFLSIILAFMNILPIPALDGGHVLFLFYEMITGRKPSENFMIRAEYVGFGILILLMVVANLNDILRWLGYM